MDLSKFIDVIKQFPQVWDRNNPSFREKDLKKICWDQIGVTMGRTGNVCRDTFKSLREKYIREREKQTIFAEKYLPWQHLDSMKFLDPQIVLRKQSLNYEEDLQTAEEYKSSFNNSSASGDAFLQNALNEINHIDFDRTLIGLVKKASPIWDRKSNSYPSKQLKYQLWKTIAQTLKKDVNVCMLRWKGLREKYIRQKSKYQEGEGKWEFLDDMSFLDKVIQYRRKQCDSDYMPQNYAYPLNCELVDADTDSSNDYSKLNSECDDYSKIKTENNVEYYDAVDSSYDSATSSAHGFPRKRSASDYSESSVSAGKRDRVEEPPTTTKSPEQMFGDLVAAMLTKKTERDKNVAMIEIMKILTKD